MRNTLAAILCVSTVLAAGCGGDSSLPEATGKGSIRAINAIPTSPEINFLIEEITLSRTLNYQAATAPDPYDDFNYTFNFEVFYAGETSLRRFASRNLDIVADREYTLFLSGTLASPTIDVWEFDEREFDTADTVFAARFVHGSASLGALDYYFADAAVVPALGNQAATLSFGEVADTADFAEGDYVLTVTTAGDPADVLYTSATATYAGRDSYLLAVFDGDASDTAPLYVNAFGNISGTTLLPDVNFPPTIQFVNASMDLGAVDIYSDEMLTTQIVSNLAFGEVSADIEILVGENNFFFTPAGATSSVLTESTLIGFGGLRYRNVAVGSDGTFVSTLLAPDLRAVETGAKTLPFQTSNNFASVDFYVVDAGTAIEDVNPTRADLATGVAAASGVLPAGSFDLYITENETKVVLAGPYRIDVAAGDVVDLIVVDTVDPTVLDVLFLSGGPSP